MSHIKKAYFETYKSTDEEREDYDNTSGYQTNSTAVQPNIPGNENTGKTDSR
jgi:hypothetical protein